MNGDLNRNYIPTIENMPNNNGNNPTIWERIDPTPIVLDIKESMIKGYANTIKFGQEVREEAFPPNRWFDRHNIKKTYANTYDFLRSWIHVPYLPILHRPGWLPKYIVGPYNDEWLEDLFSDFWAGITVGLTLIPQGLSYATLANIQPIHGLYAAVLPSAAYAIFGTSMQLAVGPVAVVSLLTGEIVTKYVPNWSDPAYYDDAASLAAEVALAVGIILTILSILNLGNLINLISIPVISGFTSGAACVIGLNQLKNAFGFSNSDVPQQGQTGYDYNYQVMDWFRHHWYERWHYTTAQLTKPNTTNPSKLLTWHKNVLSNGQLFRNAYATQICFSIYTALICIQLLKWGFKSTPERKKMLSFRVWAMFSSLVPFICIIIAAHMAWQIKHNDHYTDAEWLYPNHDYDAYYLKVVGKVPSGLNFLAIPTFKWPFLEILSQCIPISIIAYMESYSVARQVAASRGELYILNASQELWGNGIANIMAAFSSAYPVCGSFSRTALSNASGARTPLAKVTTMLVIIVALQSLTGTFQYIPQAALAAVIFGAIWNLISFTDLWEAWKHNKKDFLVMLTSWVITLAFNTEIGLAAGIGMSLFWYIYDSVLSEDSKPILVKKASDNGGIDVVLLQQPITFLTSGRLKDFISSLTFTVEIPLASNAYYRDRWLRKLFDTLDWLLIYQKYEPVEELPKAIVIDFSHVSSIDLTGLTTISEIQQDTRRLGILSVLYNVRGNVEKQLIKFGIENDTDVDLDYYLSYSGSIPVKIVRERTSVRDRKASDDCYDRVCTAYTSTTELVALDTKTNDIIELTGLESPKDCRQRKNSKGSELV